MDNFCEFIPACFNKIDVRYVFCLPSRSLPSKHSWWGQYYYAPKGYGLGIKGCASKVADSIRI